VTNPQKIADDSDFQNRFFIRDLAP